MKKTTQSNNQLLKEIDILKAEIVDLKALVASQSAVELQINNKQLIANRQPLQPPEGFAETLLETANAIIVTLDTDANIILFNGFAEKLTGYQKQAVLGKNWFELFIPKRNRLVIPEVFQDVLNKMPAGSAYENPIICRDGSERLISWRNNVLKNEHGAISGILSIGTDVTERKCMELELEKYRKNLEEQVKMRNRELEDKNRELDNALKVFVGRELIIKSLQEKIKALEIGVLDEKTIV